MNNIKRLAAVLGTLMVALRLCIVVLVAVPATGVLAARIVVTDFGDVIDQFDGTCTLREAIRSANGDVAIDACVLQGVAGADVIVLTAGTYHVDLTNGTDEDESGDGDLDISSSLEIRGVAADFTVIDGGIADSLERVFDIVASTVEVDLRDLTVTGGHEPAGNGGNIRSQAGAGMDDGFLKLSDVVVSRGRAISGGGIYSSGVLLTVRAVIENNETVGDVGVGGGIASVGRFLSMLDSDVRNNRAATGGGIYKFGGYSSVVNSRIHGNTAAGGGGTVVGGSGADSGWGGGIASFNNAIGVNGIGVDRSRIEGNQAELGGGLYLATNEYEVLHSAIVNNTALSEGGAIYSAESGFIRHTTLSGNDAPTGGGLYTASPMTLLDAVTLAGNVGGGGLFNESGASLEATLVADNVGGNCLGVTPGAGSYNLDDGDSCGFPTDNPDTPNFVNTDPLLGPLQDNGGGLPTRALLPGSPAIDAISSESSGGVNCQLSPDQRGYPRGYPPVRLLSKGTDYEYFCDIGAFEQHAPYAVDSTADTTDADTTDGLCADSNGVCTLRAAIMQANAIFGMQEIQLGSDTYALTLTGADEDQNMTGDLDIRDFVIIRGEGAGQTIIDGAALDRVFHLLTAPSKMRVSTPTHSTFIDLTIRQGAAEQGGGILASQPLRLQRTVLENNSAGNGNGGAILCTGQCELRVTDSTLRANTARFGGAISHDSATWLRLDRSTLSGNSADLGGAMEVIDSLRAVNSTISGNSASSSSGAFFATRAILDSSTISNNQAEGDTGAFFVLEPSVLHNSIVAGNRLGTDPDNCSFNPGALVSAGFNLSDTDSNDCNLSEATDLADTDPLLAPLADNDGLTQTHALLPGSPAIDAGDANRCPATDQRGFLRPEDGNGDGSAGCDVGSFEVLSADLGVTITATPDPVQVGNNITYTVTVNNAGPGSAVDAVLTVAIPASLSFVSGSAGGVDCVSAGDEVSCALGDIAAAANIQARVVATATQAGAVSVTVSVSAATADAFPGNNNSSVTTTVNAAGGSGNNGNGNTGGGGGGVIDPFWLALLILLARARRFGWPFALTPARTNGGAGDSPISLFWATPALLPPWQKSHNRACRPIAYSNSRGKYGQ